MIGKVQPPPREGQKALILSHVGTLHEAAYNGVTVPFDSQHRRNLSAPPLAAPSRFFPAHATTSPLQLLDLPLQPDFLRDQLSTRRLQHRDPLSGGSFSDGDDFLRSVSESHRSQARHAK